MVALFYFSLVDSSFKIVLSSVQPSEGVIMKKECSQIQAADPWARE